MHNDRYPGIRLSGKTRTFRGTNLLQIAMPLGGIGAGCICLNGSGGLQDFSIRHHPETSAIPDGHGFSDGAFALLHLPDSGLTRLVEGPLPVEKIYDQGLKAQGFRGGGHEGLPRFAEATFRGEYPFGVVRLRDSNLPIDVTITGFNPFIPLDDRNSGIPCAILEYRLHNHSNQPVPYQFSYHLTHLAPGTDKNAITSRNTVIPGAGVLFTNLEPPASAAFGSAALGVVDFEPKIKAMWFRGGWFDAVSALWREVDSGRFSENDGSAAAQSQGRNGGSILLSGILTAGESITYPIIICWHFPNAHSAYGTLQLPGTGAAVSANGSQHICTDSCLPEWRPYYASQWEDAGEVLKYVRENYPRLRHRTVAFHRALFSSSLPAEMLDAVSANLAILKSPTVLRQENGNIWAWEGCFSERGCCHGTCTHVWNYAQAMPHLFPSLERTLREQELLRSMDSSGHVTFRAALPDGPTRHDFHPASDGQLGGIMKVYREWQISGDAAWLHAIYPFAKRSMDFCINHWDPRRTGLLEEPHHNTYDIEFWGRDGMCSSFYLGALTAMVHLAKDSGHPEDAEFYANLARKGASAIETLFNGEYYQQEVMVSGLDAAPEFEENIQKENPESAALLRQEGPKYQYGNGCLADGVLGAWIASMCGLDSPQSKEHIRSHLAAVFKYNYKPSLKEHPIRQRPGYAMGDEPGLVLCTWPKGSPLTLPFPYSDEVWTGFEYQVASHLILTGQFEQALTIVRAARSRYDGHTRNPWNEYECGSYYARAMSSFGLLLAVSGFRYRAPTGTLEIAPQVDERPFTCFFSTATAWGTLTLESDRLLINLVEGSLAITSLSLTSNQKTTITRVGANIQAGKPFSIPLKR
ncbi:MAG TPA: GH116 family glycosyl hydrolase [Anaerolineaceae bacterium]